MSLRSRWRTSTTRWRLDGARVQVSNAWYRAAGRHIHGTRQQYRNWLSGRARARGKAPLPDRITRGIGSRVPAVRDRINPATGRPRWTDRSDGALTRWRADRERAQGRGGQSGRAAGNQHFVRARLATRQPQYARTLDRAVRDLSPRTRRAR